MTPEMMFASALITPRNEKEKIASVVQQMTVDELENFLRADVEHVTRRREWREADAPEMLGHEKTASAVGRAAKKVGEGVKDHYRRFRASPGVYGMNAVADGMHSVGQGLTASQLRRGIANKNRKDMIVGGAKTLGVYSVPAAALVASAGGGGSEKKASAEEILESIYEKLASRRGEAMAAQSMGRHSRNAPGSTAARPGYRNPPQTKSKAPAPAPVIKAAPAPSGPIAKPPKMLGTGSSGETALALREKPGKLTIPGSPASAKAPAASAAAEVAKKSPMITGKRLLIAGALGAGALGARALYKRHQEKNASADLYDLADGWGRGLAHEHMEKAAIAIPAGVTGFVGKGLRAVGSNSNLRNAAIGAGGGAALGAAKHVIAPSRDEQGRPKGSLLGSMAVGAAGGAAVGGGAKFLSQKAMGMNNSVGKYLTGAASGGAPAAAAAPTTALARVGG